MELCDIMDSLAPLLIRKWCFFFFFVTGGGLITLIFGYLKEGNIVGVDSLPVLSGYTVWSDTDEN